MMGKGSSIVKAACATGQRTRVPSVGPSSSVCAIIILCNSKATSIVNESFHSFATHILSESRRSVSTEKAEALSLMRAVLPGYLMKLYPDLKAVEAAAQAEGYPDVPPTTK